LRVFSTRATGLAHPNPIDLIAPIISCEILSQNEYKENAEWIFFYAKHQKQSKQKHYHREIRSSHSGLKV
jgi:hypothetical protein